MKSCSKSSKYQWNTIYKSYEIERLKKHLFMSAECHRNSSRTFSSKTLSAEVAISSWTKLALEQFLSLLINYQIIIIPYSPWLNTETHASHYSQYLKPC